MFNYRLFDSMNKKDDLYFTTLAELSTIIYYKYDVRWHEFMRGRFNMQSTLKICFIYIIN
jgi:hypothetical protein